MKVNFVYPLKYICGRFILKENIEYNKPEEVVQDCIDFVQEERHIFYNVMFGKTLFVPNCYQDSLINTELRGVLLSNDLLFNQMKSQLNFPFAEIENLILQVIKEPALCNDNDLLLLNQRFPLQFQEALIRYLNDLLDYFISSPSRFILHTSCLSLYAIDNLSEDTKKRFQKDFDAKKGMSSEGKKRFKMLLNCDWIRE